MKTKSSLLSIIILFLVLVNTFAQKAKIKTSKAEVVTVISGIGEKEIYTESGVIPIAEIEKIIFEKFESQFESQYAKLSKFFPVEYGDGTNLGGVEGQVFSNPTQPLSPLVHNYIPRGLFNKSFKKWSSQRRYFFCYWNCNCSHCRRFPCNCSCRWNNEFKFFW